MEGNRGLPEAMAAICDEKVVYNTKKDYYLCELKGIFNCITIYYPSTCFCNL